MKLTPSSVCCQMPERGVFDYNFLQAGTFTFRLPVRYNHPQPKTRSSKRTARRHNVFLQNAEPGQPTYDRTLF
jgi:hypothetical protein